MLTDEALRGAILEESPPEDGADYSEYLAFRAWLARGGRSAEGTSDAQLRGWRERFAAIRAGSSRGIEGPSLEGRYWRTLLARKARLEELLRREFDERSARSSPQRLFAGGIDRLGEQLAAKSKELESFEERPLRGAEAFRGSVLNERGKRRWEIVLRRADGSSLGMVELLLQDRGGAELRYPICTEKAVASIASEDLKDSGLDLSLQGLKINVLDLLDGSIEG